MTTLVMPQVEPLGVSALKPLHPFAEVSSGGLKEEMDVVVHQAIRKPIPSELVARIVQEREVRPTVGIVGEEISTINPSRPDVVQPTVQDGSGLPRHTVYNPGS